MRVRGWAPTSLAVATALAAGAAPAATATGSGVIALPPPGNVNVAQLSITAKAGASSKTPALRVADNGKLPATAFVVGGVTRDAAGRGRFVATVAVFNRPPPDGTPSTPAPGSVGVRLPAGYTLTRQAVATGVLYQNARPASSFPVPPGVSTLAGTPPPKIAVRRLLVDARKLALDQNVPVADMELLGFPYVSAELAHVAGNKTSFVVTVAVANLGQVNAVRLTFPAGTTFTSATAPPLADASPMGTALQLTATQGFFTEAAPYRFTFTIGQALPGAAVVTLQASTHYFENVLPFTERLWIPV